MPDARKILCWIFALTAVWYTFASLRSAYAFTRPSALLTPSSVFINLLFPGFVVIINGLAWWVILKEKASAKAWGTAASLTYVLIFLKPILFSLPSVWPHHEGALLVGIVGLITFLARR